MTSIFSRSSSMAVAGHSELETEYESDFDMPRQVGWREKCRNCCMNHLQSALTFLGLLGGIGLGIGLKYLEPSENAILWIGMPGEIMMRLLRMMVLPLLLSCVTSGISKLSRPLSARVLLVCFAYILLTSLLASVIGVAMGFAFSPGLKGNKTVVKDRIQTPHPHTLELCADFLRNVFPNNIITASLQMEQTNYSTRPFHIHELMKYKIPKMDCNSTENRTQESLRGSNATLNESHTCATPSLGRRVTPSQLRDTIAVDGLDVLGLVFFACVIGLSASTPTRSGRPLRILFTSFADVVQRAAQWFYWICPVGMISYTTASILSAPDVRSTIPSLGYFILAVLAAAAIHQVVILQVLHAGITRTNPFKLQLRRFRSWLLLLGTSSSDVVMSELMEACRKEGIDGRVYELGIPFATALNRNGDALYITAAGLYISQLHGILPDPKTIVVIVLLAIFMSILAPRTSNGTILTLTAILSIVRLPTTYIPMLVSIDWLMSRLRTTCDGISSCYCVRFTFAACQDRIETYDIDQQIMYSIRSLNRLSRALSGSESGMVTVV